jgi:hypothetical protein
LTGVRAERAGSVRVPGLAALAQLLPHKLQVFEAQPDVIEAKRSGGRAQTAPRSISLTPFGEDFCRVCLPWT